MCKLENYWSLLGQKMCSGYREHSGPRFHLLKRRSRDCHVETHGTSGAAVPHLPTRYLKPVISTYLKS